VPSFGGNGGITPVFQGYQGRLSQGCAGPDDAKRRCLVQGAFQDFQGGGKAEVRQAKA
jgi:hypothetical protein